MTKLSQCTKCVRDRKFCGQYKQEDDTDCPHYSCGGHHSEMSEESHKKVGLTYASFWILYIFIGFVIGFSRYFKDTNILFLLAIPLIVLIVWIVVKKVRKRRDHHQIQDSQTAMTPPQVMPTRTLLQLALRQLGIEYDFDEDNCFIAIYQGEHFKIVAENDSRIIDIYDLWWYHAPLDDIDNLSLVKQAVNDYNIRGKAKLVYSFSREDDVIGVHGMMHFVWVEGIPNIDQYLRAQLDIMLAAHQQFYQIMEHLRRENA